MSGVPLRLPMIPASTSASSSAACRMSTALGGRPFVCIEEPCLFPLTRLPGRWLLEVELLVEVLEVLRYPVVLIYPPMLGCCRPAIVVG